MQAAAYARYSTEHQSENSIEAQLNGINDYCRANDIEVVRTYIDEAQSGTSTNRTGFQNLIRGAEQRAFQAVIIYDITRGSRDVVDWFSFRKEMLRLGIQVISATERLGDVLDPNAFLVELLSVGIGQHQVLTTRQKSHAGVENIAKKGLFCGGTPPLGYTIDPDGHYLVEDREAAAVRHIFRAYADGDSYACIVDWLSDHGIRSKRGKTIGTNALYAILRNERYIGRYSWNKRKVKLMGKWAGGKANPDAVVIEDAIPRIIDAATWERVQKRIMENEKNKCNKSRVNREYLLSGLIRCRKCGGAWGGVTTISSKGYEHSYYTCLNKRRLHTCDAKNMAAADIEPLVVNCLKNEILNGDLIESTADAILQACKDDGADNTDAIKREISATEKKIENLLHTLEDGFDNDMVRNRIIGHQAHLKILHDRLAAAQPAPTITREELIQELYRDRELLLADPHYIRQALQKYIVNILVDDEVVEINAVSEYLANRAIPGGLYVCRGSETVNTAGCGSQI